MTTIRQEKRSDAAAREQLLDAAYGPVRFSKPSERLRRGHQPADGLSFVAVVDGQLVGTLRLWPVTAGVGRPALLLGPLAVHPDFRKRGIGAALVKRALRAARNQGHRAVLLVGDASYYARFGFSAEKTGRLRLQGLGETRRLLGLELTQGALDGARGSIGLPESRIPALAPLVEAIARRARPLVPQAA